MSGTTCTAERPGASEQRLPPQPASVGAARRMIRELLLSAGREDLRDAAELLVSEVVTNALLHAGTEIEVNASLDSGVLRVEVGDGSLHLPVRRRYGATSGTGRGLLMLEQMVDDWGVTRHDGGKTVWFILTDGDREFEPPSERLEVAPGAPEEGGPAPSVDVELLNVPLLLHAAWQEHAEALLREYLLASLDDEDDIGAIQVHAEATDAIAILEESIPRVDVDLEPDRLMQGATEPRVSLARMILPVPATSVAHFEVLDRTIESSIALSHGGRAFTPPTPPEIQLFRRWLCRQVLDQAAGAPAEAWTVEGEPEPRPVHDPDWDVASVAHAPTGRIAADEANRILAVSPPALALLGYRQPAELVGRRLVAIIPDRYRQAHVAGFTMFLVAGRRPLLGTPVIVPALRRDGREVRVNLLIEFQQVADGRTIFVAELTPADVP